ncbi:MAG TPA: DUF4349 domain-containing protein [Ktedonobacteraceae bacterium]|nr:DUF4349 domain-containing protein [Ktedonobacteraceae bacterium]
MKRIHANKSPNRLAVLLIGFVTLAVLLVGCAGSGTSTAGSTSVNAPDHQSTNASAQATNTSSDGSSSSGSNQPQYLIKSLSVNMAVKDTRQVASDLQSWITTTDPRASSAGIDYQQVGDNSYNVSLTFSVESSDYTRVEEYLTSYAAQHNGKLLNLHESVQDATNDYIDTQSRLTNLRGEQARLLTLLSQTQALGDIITVQDKLTDVEGQIEDIEAHLNALKNQTTFYTVTINLQPIAPIASTPPPQNASWNPGQVVHDALSAALGFGQGLATLVIWLGAFCIYLIPAGAVVWYFWKRKHPGRLLPPAAVANPPQPKA